VLLGVLAAGSLAACTSTEPGTAAPEGQGTSTNAPPPGTITTQQPGEPTVAIPPRPKTLSLDGVEPCSLFPDAAQQQLNITRARSRTTDDVYKAPECALDATADGSDISYSALAITTEGIGAWLDGKRTVVAKLISVGGYAAVDYYPKGVGSTTDGNGCSTSVDVADGQQLMVEVLPLEYGKFSQDQQCQMTEKAAALAVSTLQSTR
jgi:uncharacterized protein DUF3558